MSLFRSFFQQEKPVQEHGIGLDRQTKLLPSDVRYALTYRSAELGSSELKDLINNNFLDEAIYLVLKSLDSLPEKQKKLLEDIVNAEVMSDVAVDKEQIIKASLLESLKLLPTNNKVLGTKLAQLSRQGFDQWQQWIKEKSTQYKEANKECYLVAYATLIGVRGFLKSYKGSDIPLFVLIPNRIEEVRSDYVGYKINCITGSVEHLPPDFERSKSPVIFDDTINTGRKMEELVQFWVKDGHSTVPDVDAVIKSN